MTIQHFELSAFLSDGNYPAVIRRLTGTDTALDLDTLFEGLHLPFETIDPIKTTIWDRHNQAVAAAFAAGIACGLEPERLLLVRLQAACNRLERCVDVLGAVQIAGMEGES